MDKKERIQKIKESIEDSGLCISDKEYLERELEKFIKEIEEDEACIKTVTDALEEKSIVIEKLDNVTEMIEQKEERIFQFADTHVSIIHNKPKHLIQQIDWIKKRVVSRLKGERLVKEHNKLVEVQHQLEVELYDANLAIIEMKDIYEKIDVLKKYNVDSANTVVRQINRAKEENRELEKVNRYIKKRRK